MNITSFVSTWSWVYWRTPFTSFYHELNSISSNMGIRFLSAPKWCISWSFLTPHILDYIQQQLYLQTYAAYWKPFCLTIVVISALFISDRSILILSWRSNTLISSPSVPNQHLYCFIRSHSTYAVSYLIFSISCNPHFNGKVMPLIINFSPATFIWIA